MATYTSNYGWTKPSGSDNVDISVLNDNLDDQDSTIHDAFLNMAPPFSESSTYAVDDIVLYTTGLYKCHTAVVTPGSWTGSTNWQVYKLSEGGSGGGTSNYNDLSNKPSINGVTLSGNKTTSDLGITASGVGAIPSTDKGANGGVAELDSNGKVPSSQLPSYVDDVLSYSSQSAFPATGETGKIYIAEDTNKTYRWSGSAYAEISASLALGETSSTAYRGDRGKTAYDHSQTTGNPHSTTAADVGLGNVPNVTTNDQTPTFTEASTRNNIASGEKLSVILGKVQKFFNDLKTVAFSGSYTDLSNKPTIPAAQVNSDWNASSGVAEILNKPSSYKPSSHTHGNIQNGGTLQTTDIAVANGDKLVVTDSSNSAKIARTSVTFDGTTTTQALSKKGTFETFSKFSGSYTDLTNKPTIPTSAGDISYDNTDSGLSATDVQGAVDEVVGKMGNMRMSKLWENPNTAINFDAQTIQLSSSNYDLLLVIARYATTFGDNVSNISSGTSGYVTFGLAGSDGPANYSRLYSINGNQVTFGDCQMSAHNSPSKVTANNTLIPYQIYGIKLT